MAKHEPFLSDKNKATEKIALVSDNNDDLEIAKKFNEFFKKAVNNFDLSANEDLLSTMHLSDPVQIAIEIYKNHPSIMTIQNNVTID